MTSPRRALFRAVAAAGALVGLVGMVSASPAESAKPPVGPVVPLSVSVVDTGPLNVPWDVVFAPDGTMLFDERGGGITARPPGQPQRSLTTSEDFADLFAEGEGGLLGMAVDPRFARNRRIYTCETVSTDTGTFNQVRRWTIDREWTKATRTGTVIADAKGGDQHAGCRLLFDATGRYLYVSLGDAITGTYPQDPKVLAGKVLRVNKNGKPARGNPDLGGDPRVYTVGHRNPQGLALRPGTDEVWEVEHGPNRDDEVNLLSPGGNYGWNPVGGPCTSAPNCGSDGLLYDQTVPMTAAGALPAKYSTGFPTLAMAGATFVTGTQWGAMDGALVVGALRSRRLLSFGVTGQALTAPAFPRELLKTYGRLRTPRMGPDGALYVTTSNGDSNLDGVGEDKILRITPRATATAR